MKFSDNIEIYDSYVLIKQLKVIFENTVYSIHNIAIPYCRKTDSKIIKCSANLSSILKCVLNLSEIHEFIDSELLVYSDSVSPFSNLTDCRLFFCPSQLRLQVQWTLDKRFDTSIVHRAFKTEEFLR